jgi:hypothetical protein
MSSEVGQSRKVLSSWKEIAAHFGVTVRTAQLWETERSLPVYRMPGVKGRVFAYLDELEAWAKGAADGKAPAGETPPVSTPQRPKKLVWLAAGTLIAAAAVLPWFSRLDPVPSAYEINGRTLTVMDANNNPIWRHEFSKQVVPKWKPGGEWTPFPETMPWIGDIDGDGLREVLFTYSSDPKQVLDSEIYCFEADGRIRWKYKPGRLVETREEQFPTPFFVRMVRAMERAGGKPPLLLVVASHGVFYPSLIAALSPEGKVLREYWHSGHINALAATDLDQDSKPELYLFANHNPSKSFSVIALDPEDFGGASKESNPDYQLLNLGEARELGRIVIPRSEMTRQLGDLGNPGGLNVQSGRLVIQALQTSSRPDLEYQPGVLYQFGPRLELAGIEYAWTFKGMYDRMVRTAKIKPYDLDADLERMGKKIEVVTPWRAGGQK